MTVAGDQPTFATAAEEPLTLGARFLHVARRHAGPALRCAGAAEAMSYEELARAVREIAGGLMDLGIASGDRVSILGETRPEWTLADLGVLAAGAVVVPIYHTNAPEECAYVLAHAGSRVIFCEDAAQAAKIDAVRADCPELEHVVVLTGSAPGAIALADLRGRGAALAQADIEARAATPRMTDVATLVYTSGTTGTPKGCMLTHANVTATMQMYEGRLGLQADPPSIFLFLPLAHVLARVTQFVALDVGGVLVFWNRDARRLPEDLAAGRPSHVPAVPRVYEKVQRAVLDRLEDESDLRRSVFRRALATGRALHAARAAGRRPGPALRMRHALGDRVALRHVREAFGGELRQALVGAAPIGAEVVEFFQACGVELLEGYGMTESCAAATLNAPGDARAGTVGRPLEGTGLAIAPDGEVLLRGPNVFAGYYRDAPSTAETLRGGWLHTGDTGSVDAEGRLRITGRSKELIITSSGKNIAPAGLENALRETRWISQAVVVGDRRPYLVALLTLDADELPALADRVGLPADAAVLARDPRVHEQLQADVDAVNARVARIEQIKRFAVLDHDLTQADGELTPTLKVRRAVVCERYADELTALYA